MKIVTPGIYQHYKGKLYEVIGTARLSEDAAQEFVVYKQLYESIGPDDQKLPYGTLWIRPATMFCQTITLPSGECIPRFSYQTNNH